MKRTVNPRAIEIQRRFFSALDFLISSGAIPGGLKEFCADNGFNRVKYSRLKNSLNAPIEEMTYKCIDIDALAAICGRFGISAEWLLTGKGKMSKKAFK